MDLPFIVEIVDTEEKINGFLPVLDEMMNGGLVTLEKARVIHYAPTRNSQCLRTSVSSRPASPLD